MAEIDPKLYFEILNQILEDATESDDDSISARDDGLIETSANEPANQSEYNDRDHLYTMLLGNYIDKNNKKARHNAVYKAIFFSVSMLLLLGAVVGAFVALCIVCSKEKVSVEDVIAVLGGMTSFVSAIIVLPKIIAEHLFPTNEDENMIDMVKNMQLNDSNIRDYLKRNSRDQDKQQ